MEKFGWGSISFDSALIKRSNMDSKLKSLFTPWKIGNCEIKNRIVLAPMGGTNLFGWMEPNHFDEAGADFIMDVAKNNVGLIIPGCQSLYNPMMGQWLYKNDRMYKELESWMPKFHKTGAKLFVQLTAGFGRVFPITKEMEAISSNPWLRKVSSPILDVRRITASASILPNRWSNKIHSRPMKIDEIHEMVDAFARTSLKLKEAGVDGVEVHALHEGYLLDQFAHKYTNNRVDKYGGSLFNRYRFAIEIVRAIKNACGKDFPVSIRYSVVSKTKGFGKGALPNEEDYVEVGRDLKESEKVVRLLTKAGYDMLNCDNGTYDAWYWNHPPAHMPKSCNLKEAEHIRKFTNIPVVCAGKMDLYDAVESIENGGIDAAAFGRSFLADQEWVTKLIDDKKDDIRPCIECHNACFNMARYKGSSNIQDLNDATHLSRCAVNAETLQKNEHFIERTVTPRKVIIIGGGIGGMEVARILKKRGHIPVIFEKDDRLGGMLNFTDSEVYQGKLKELVGWYRNQIKKQKIEVHLNKKIEDISQFGDSDIIIATGSVPILIDNIPGSEKIIDVCKFINNPNDVGEKVAIIGGNIDGCEVAYMLANTGKKPVIIESKNDLIAQKGICLANSSYLRDWFKFNKVPVYLESTLKEVNDDGIIIDVKDRGLIKIKCDSVVSSVGFKPKPLVKKGKRVQLVGDCDSVGNLRTVIWSAYEAAMKVR